MKTLIRSAQWCLIFSPLALAWTLLYIVEIAQ